MKSLFIGLGSIAKKHLEVLWHINPTCKVYALRSGVSNHEEPNVTNIFSWQDIPSDIDFVLISNPTSEHFNAIEKSINLNVPLFIEKPPLMHLQGADELLERIKNSGIRTYTAFNFRFHPVIIWLKEYLKGKKIIEVQAYCGTYLPDWRPGRDYRDIYSAKMSLGGGVHLDLIHELDFVIWLLGSPNHVLSTKRKISDLLIDSFDLAHYILEYDGMHASILLNYFRRDSKRTLEIVTETETLSADLLKGRVVNVTTGNELFYKAFNPMDTYLAQMKYFLDNLNGEDNYMNNLHESASTLKICLS